MALRFFKMLVYLTFTFLIIATNAVSLYSVIDSLKEDAARRCALPTCDKTLMKENFNNYLDACSTGGCETDFVIRVLPFAHGYIQQFCVLSDQSQASDLSVRIQVDLIPQGARMVLVAVPRSSKTQPETFQRPYVLSEIIPRNQLYIVNQFVKKYCGVTF